MLPRLEAEESLSTVRSLLVGTRATGRSLHRALEAWERQAAGAATGSPKPGRLPAAALAFAGIGVRVVPKVTQDG